MTSLIFAHLDIVHCDECNCAVLEVDISQGVQLAKTAASAPFRRGCFGLICCGRLARTVNFHMWKDSMGGGGHSPRGPMITRRGANGAGCCIHGTCAS